MITKKFLMLTLWCSVLSAADESRPTKDQIRKEIMQLTTNSSDVADLIAQYAENPVMGFIYIPKCDARRVSEFDPGHFEFYQNSWPEFAEKLTPTSVVVTAYCTSLALSSNDMQARPWFAFGCPDIPRKIDGNFKDLPGSLVNFPNEFPASLLQGKKEGDHIKFYLNDIPFLVTCSQLTHKYNKLNATQPCRFEQAFEHVTRGLLEDTQKKDQKDEDD